MRALPSCKRSESAFATPLAGLPTEVYSASTADEATFKTEKLVSPLDWQSFSPTASYSDTNRTRSGLVSEYTVPAISLRYLLWSSTAVMLSGPPASLAACTKRRHFDSRVPLPDKVSAITSSSTTPCSPSLQSKICAPDFGCSA